MNVNVRSFFAYWKAKISIREETINKAQRKLNELSLYYKFGTLNIVETTQFRNVSVFLIHSDKPEGSGI